MLWALRQSSSLTEVSLLIDRNTASLSLMPTSKGVQVQHTCALIVWPSISYSCSRLRFICLVQSNQLHCQKHLQTLVSLFLSVLTDKQTTLEAMDSPVTPGTPPATSVTSSTPRIFGNDSLSKRISQFQSAAEKNRTNQKQNPFSGSFECTSLRGKFNFSPNDPK